MTQLTLTAMTHATAVQVGLGIATLMNYVPISLAILHQVSNMLYNDAQLVLLTYTYLGWFCGSSYYCDFLSSFFKICQIY